MTEKKRGTNPRTALSQKAMAELEQRTILGLTEKHQRFAREHQTDSDEQLLEYVRQCAAAIGHSPCSGEVIGGPFIAKRLAAGWGGVLLMAGLPPADHPPLPQKKWSIFKAEYKRQAKLRRQEKARRKQKENGPPKGRAE